MQPNLTMAPVLRIESDHGSSAIKSEHGTSSCNRIWPWPQFMQPNMIIADIPEVCRQAGLTTHLYAVDIQSYMHVFPQESLQAVQSMMTALDQLNDWSLNREWWNVEFGRPTQPSELQTSLMTLLHCLYQTSHCRICSHAGTFDFNYIRYLWYNNRYLWCDSRYRIYLWCDIRHPWYDFMSLMWYRISLIRCQVPLISYQISLMWYDDMISLISGIFDIGYLSNIIISPLP